MRALEKWLARDPNAAVGDIDESQIALQRLIEVYFRTMSSSSEDEATIINRLVVAMPEFKPLVEDHLAFYGELLTHLVMADFARWLIEKHVRARSGDRFAAETVKRGLAFLEATVADAGYPAGQDLVAVSFLENLPERGDEIESFRAELGPHLKMRRLRARGQMDA